MVKTEFRRILFAFCLVGSTVAFGQDYYVVIGSFATETAAIKYAGYARSIHYDASHIMNETNKLYYVYVLKTPDRKLASEQTFRLQKETEFTDAWMYSKTATRPAEVIVEKEPEVPEVPAVIEAPQKDAPVIKETQVDPPVVEELQNQQDPAISFGGPVKPVAKGTFFKFMLTNTDGKTIPGQVYNVDRLQGRDLATYKANEYVDVRKPVQGMPITIVCEIFGYLEVVRLIDYNNPLLTEGATQDENGVWVVPMTLQRIKKGDVSVMYRVSFYKDAVIMLPSSKPELDELVSMMKMNPTYKIKIHGHNNGNEKGIRIVTLGSDKNYFSMARSSSRTGSAKDLSQMRANAIKSYLIDNGIDKDRIDTYAWGGTAMLATPGTAAATRLNNRIEIEITHD